MSIDTSKFSINFLKANIPFFKEIKSAGLKSGASIYLVGGSVRDMAMGAKVKDVDLVPFGIGYEEFGKLVAKILKVPAINFKDNVRLTKNGTIIDISKPRGHNIFQDLQKRDFTINNLACDMGGNIFGDVTHVRNHTIKAVTDNVFDDDPLRILRAYRFKAVLGFSIDKTTASLIKEKKHLITVPAKERILDELKKAFAGDYFTKIIEDELFLEVCALIAQNCNLNPKNVLRLKASKNNCDNIFCVFLVLFFEGVSAAEFFKSLPLSSKELKTINYLLTAEKGINFAELSQQDYNRKTAWRYFKDLKILILFLQSKYPEYYQMLETLLKSAATLSPEKADTISGDDLKTMGLDPSPIFAHILNDAKEQLALNLIEPEKIKEYVKEKYKIGSL